MGCYCDSISTLLERLFAKCGGEATMALRTGGLGEVVAHNLKRKAGIQSDKINGPMPFLLTIRIMVAVNRLACSCASFVFHVMGRTSDQSSQREKTHSVLNGHDCT